MKYLLISIFFSTLIFTACKKEPSINDKILAIIKDSLNVEQQYDKIFVLQEHGCIVCNKKIVEYLSENQELNNELIIVSMQNVDGYLADSNIKQFKNVVIDRKSLFYKTNVLNHSAVILFKESKIDTILNFSDARVYDQNIEYLSSR